MMNVEQDDTEWIEIGPKDEGMFLGGYPADLYLSQLFTNPQTLGGLWREEDDSLLTLMPSEREMKMGAANLELISHLEQRPVEEIAPQQAFWQESLSEQYFGRRVRDNAEFFDLARENFWGAEPPATVEPIEQRMVGFWESAVRSLQSSSWAVPEYVNRLLTVMPAISDSINPFLKPGEEGAAGRWHRLMVEPIMQRRRQLDPQVDERQGILGQIGTAVGSLPRDAALTAGTLATLPATGSVIGMSAGVRAGIPAWRAAWSYLLRGTAGSVGPAVIAGMDRAEQARADGADEVEQMVKAVEETALSLASAAVPLSAPGTAKTKALRFLQRTGTGFASSAATNALVEQVRARLEMRRDLDPDLSQAAIDAIPMAILAGFLGPHAKALSERKVKIKARKQPAKENPYRDEKTGELLIFQKRRVPDDPIQAAAFNKFREVTASEKEADRLYDMIADAKGGKVIGTDIARELLPEYATREGKILYTEITNDLAYFYARDRFWRELNNPGKRTQVLLAAGGPGAGKSTAINDALSDGVDLVLDSTLSNRQGAEEVIDMALSRGWDVKVAYKQRAFEDVVKGVIERADESGRCLPLATLPSSHINAQRSVVELSEIYGKDRRVRFELFLPGSTDQISSVAEIDAGGRWHYYENDEQQRRREMGQGSGETAEKVSRDALERGNREAFRRAVRGKTYEQRILEQLARGDEELLGYIEQYYGKISDNFKVGVENEKAISKDSSAISRFVAEQSRAFKDAAKEAEDRGSSGAGQSAQSGGSGRALAEWAQATGKVIEEDALSEWPFVSDATSEHTVLYREADDRAIKVTKGLYYGELPVVEAGRLTSRGAKPSEYLRRMELQVQVFHSDLRLEGIHIPKESMLLVDAADAPQIVVSQRWYESVGDVNNGMIDAFLTREGFRKVPNSFYGWVREEDGVVIQDATPDNFVLTKAGLVPIDLQMNRLTSEEVISLKVGK